MIKSYNIMKKELAVAGIIFIIVILGFSLVSAGWFSDFLNNFKFTGKILIRGTTMTITTTTTAPSGECFLNLCSSSIIPCQACVDKYPDDDSKAYCLSSPDLIYPQGICGSTTGSSDECTANTITNCTADETKPICDIVSKTCQPCTIFGDPDSVCREKYSNDPEKSKCDDVEGSSTYGQCIAEQGQCTEEEGAVNYLDAAENCVDSEGVSHSDVCVDANGIEIEGDHYVNQKTCDGEKVNCIDVVSASPHIEQCSENKICKNGRCLDCTSDAQCTTDQKPFCYLDVVSDLNYGKCVECNYNYLGDDGGGWTYFNILDRCYAKDVDKPVCQVDETSPDVGKCVEELEPLHCYALNDDCSEESSNPSFYRLSFYPECIDGIKNGEETDVDCGGSVCIECEEGGNCIKDSDCKLGVGLICSKGKCSSLSHSCYQETADMGTDKYCGELSTGSYSYSGYNERNFKKVKDEKWTGSSFGIPSGIGADKAAILKITYAKPKNLISATWRVKDSISEKQLNLPKDCLKDDFVKLEVYSYKGKRKADNYVQYRCFDGIDYYKIISTSSRTYKFYEEGMSWIISEGCIADCEGKECGDDGCGGSCGGCLKIQSCVGGRCT